MSINVLCSDQRCPARKRCYRFIADPIKELKENKRIKIESSLRIATDDWCVFYQPIKDSEKI